MGVDFCCFTVLVAKQSLDVADIGSGFQ